MSFVECLPRGDGTGDKISRILGRGRRGIRGWWPSTSRRVRSGGTHWDPDGATPAGNQPEGPNVRGTDSWSCDRRWFRKRTQPGSATARVASARSMTKFRTAASTRRKPRWKMMAFAVGRQRDFRRLTPRHPTVQGCLKGVRVGVGHGSVQGRSRRGVVATGRLVAPSAEQAQLLPVQSAGITPSGVQAPERCNRIA